MSEFAVTRSEPIRCQEEGLVCCREEGSVCCHKEESVCCQ